MKNVDVSGSMVEIVQFCHRQMETSGMKQIENSGGAMQFHK